MSPPKHRVTKAGGAREGTLARLGRLARWLGTNGIPGLADSRQENIGELVGSLQEAPDGPN